MRRVGANPGVQNSLKQGLIFYNMSIIDKISEFPESITEEDVKSWILPELIDFFDYKYSSLSKYAFGYHEGSDIGRRAIKAAASEVLKKGLEVFLFKSQHWRTGRPLQPYLATCLNRMAEDIKREVSSTGKKKTTSPVCPACKSFNEKEFLIYESKKLRCNVCTNSQNLLEDRIVSSKNSSEKSRLEYELSLRKIFSLHSRKGYKCPDCARFIPGSYTKNNQRVSCPYDVDCGWFGHISELEPMAHPLGLSSENNLSLNSPIQFEGGKEIERQDYVKSEIVNADIQIEVRQKCEQEISVLQSVISIQKARIEREPIHKSIKKVLMYEAFENMLDKYPEEMISYLVHQNHAGDLPIQARIFQEFISLVENSLPFEIYFQGEIVEIYSLQDPRLDLFIGLSEFDASVKADGTIPNLTKEVYIGSRKGNDRGACFIGNLIDVRAKDIDQSLIDFVEFYTFSQIKMMEDIPPGISVTVKHFRIPSHYEMHGLVYLQRIRRRIVDSVYQRLHGKKRITNNS